MTAVAIARRIAFWLGAVERVIGVLAFCFLVWFFMVIASLTDPEAVAILASVALATASVGWIAKTVGDSQRSKVVYGGLLALVTIPLIAAQVAVGAS